MSEQGEWTAEDAPIVTKATDPDRSCASCRCWSQWLSTTGDCLFHALQRREQMIERGQGGQGRLPMKSARMTAEYETCEAWTSLSDVDLRRRSRRQTMEQAT